jgi:hypothetical protein
MLEWASGAHLAQLAGWMLVLMLKWASGAHLAQLAGWMLVLMFKWSQICYTLSGSSLNVKKQTADARKIRGSGCKGTWISNPNFSLVVL